MGDERLFVVTPGHIADPVAYFGGTPRVVGAEEMLSEARQVATRDGSATIWEVTIRRAHVVTCEVKFREVAR